MLPFEVAFCMRGGVKDKGWRAFCRCNLARLIHLLARAKMQSVSQGWDAKKRKNKLGSVRGHKNWGKRGVHMWGILFFSLLYIMPRNGAPQF